MDSSSRRILQRAEKHIDKFYKKAIKGKKGEKLWVRLLFQMGIYHWSVRGCEAFLSMPADKME